MAALEEEIDRLYTLPLSEFTRERNAAASRLRKAGDREAAEELKKLRKPTAAAWAINQAARRHPDQRSELLAAGEELRNAQAEALSGGGAAAIAEATRREREAVSALVESALETLEVESAQATRQTLDKIEATLRATTVDEEARHQLERFRLTDDLEPTGFGPFLGAVPERKRTVERATPSDERRERLQRARADLKEAQSRERELRKLAADAEREAHRARRQADEAEERARAASANAEAASEQVAAAEQALEQLAASE